MWPRPFFCNALGQDLVVLPLSLVIVALWLRANGIVAQRIWLP